MKNVKILTVRTLGRPDVFCFILGSEKPYTDKLVQSYITNEDAHILEFRCELLDVGRLDNLINLVKNSERNTERLVQPDLNTFTIKCCATTKSYEELLELLGKV